MNQKSHVRYFKFEVLIRRSSESIKQVNEYKNESQERSPSWRQGIRSPKLYMILKTMEVDSFFLGRQWRWRI